MHGKGLESALEVASVWVSKDLEQAVGSVLGFKITSMEELDVVPMDTLLQNWAYAEKQEDEEKEHELTTVPF